MEETGLEPDSGVGDLAEVFVGVRPKWGDTLTPSDVDWNCLSCRDSKQYGPRSALASSLCTPIPRPERGSSRLRSGRSRTPSPHLESPGQSSGSLREASSPEPDGEAPGRVAPPPGSRRGGPRRLRLQLPLPYKAGAGPRRGRGCGRRASSPAVQLRRVG